MALDFSGQNLRGRSFRGQDLAGANFSFADIRGANFAGAKLQDANFFKVTAGLQKRWAWVLVGLSWLAAGISGFFSAFTGYIIVGFITAAPTAADHQVYQACGWSALVVVAIILILLLWRGLSGAGIGALAGVGVVVAALALTLTSTLAIAGVGAIAGAIAGAVALAIVVIETLVIVVAGALVLAGALAGAVVAPVFAPGIPFSASALAEVATISLCSGFIAWRATQGDDKYASIRDLAVALASFRGTSFRRTNLTNANFADANLKSSDFRQAILVGTHFRNVTKLDLARPGNSYLKSRQLRQLIVSGDVKDKNFDRQDLRGINLQGAHLVGASFIGADLSNANLQEADLSQSKLVQAQVDGTDFTGATLTGAFIQDWNITTTTKFDGVKCEYIYMRQPTPDNPEPHRKPDNRQEEFADGEFGDFIKPIFDTLDLYHSQGVDPRAIAIAFKELAERHPDARLAIVAIEKRGEDKILLRAQTAPQADKSALSAEYHDAYNRIKGLSPEQIAIIITEKDDRIKWLQQTIETTLQRPNYFSNHNIHKVDTMTNNPCSFSVGDNMSGKINNVQGDGNRTIQGNDNQIDRSTAPTNNLSQAEILNQLTKIVDLIKQSELPPDTKTEIIEDLTAVQTATDKPEPNKTFALERLESAATSIEKTSKTLEATQKIWTMAKPMMLPIAKWLGAAAGSTLLGL